MLNVRFKVTGLSQLLKRMKKTHTYYADLHDNGGARFSREAAQAFLGAVTTNIMTGRYNARFSAISGSGITHYAQKYDKGFGNPWGVLSGKMKNHLEVFRSRFGGDSRRRGHVVGIRPDGYYKFSAMKLEVFEKGGRKKGWADGTYQKSRPIMALSLADFMREEFPLIWNRTQREFYDIWRT